MSKYVLFDTETTGADLEDRIIQIGIMIVDSETGEVEVIDELCSTETNIKVEAMAVHNITPEIIEGRSSFKETQAWKKLNELNCEENYLIAHNLPFDFDMLEKEDFENKYTLIDTLRVAQHLLPDEKSHSLQILRYSKKLYLTEHEEARKLGITIKAHDAIGDVLVMKLLLRFLVSEGLKQHSDCNIMEKMAELSNKPVLVKIFKFGKYKDRLIEEVVMEDKGYLKWMQKNMDLDPNMEYTLNHYL